MAPDSAESKPPRLRGQLATCALFSGLAIALTLLLQRPPPFHRWREGQSILMQIGVVVTVAVIGYAAMILVLRLPFVTRRIKLPPALASMDFKGHVPLIIGGAAGIGEELLFRAGLLPLTGLWVSSALFALAHARTAMLAASWFARVAYIANTFVAGIVLGEVFLRVGLLAAIGVHALVDILGLSAMHRLKSASRP